MQWLELFPSLSSVQRLNIPAKLELFITALLKGLTEESAAEVLPALEDLLLEGYMTGKLGDVQQSIQSFGTARQHSDHPVSVYPSSTT
jgi:hypothetical protein